MPRVYDHEMTGQEQNAQGLWTPTIDTVSFVDGVRHKFATFSGGFGFPTQEQAKEAGARAVAIVKATGAFPNMCEAY